MPLRPSPHPLYDEPPCETENSKFEQKSLVFDVAILQHESNITTPFIWPDHEKPCLHPPELAIPPIDLASFSSGDPSAVSRASQLVNEACKKHGFFLVVNHGVNLQLIAKAHEHMDVFFGMQLTEKEKVQRKMGESCGYVSSFVGRFSSKLPWKGTISFRYCADGKSSNIVQEYLLNVMGEDFREFGKVYQKYCEAMNNLSIRIMELLGVSLGVGWDYFRDFFQGNDSIMRLNYYPPCQKPELTLGTGPHCDPTSLTILHQDQVSGLQVFVDGHWRSVNPQPEAFVVNIGDTFVWEVIPTPLLMKLEPKIPSDAIGKATRAIAETSSIRENTVQKDDGVSQILAQQDKNVEVQDSRKAVQRYRYYPTNIDP